MILNVEPTCTRARDRAHTQALLGKKYYVYQTKTKTKKVQQELKSSYRKPPALPT